MKQKVLNPNLDALCDTGVLAALFRSKDSNHDRSRDVVSRFSRYLVTTWPVLTEAFYLLSEIHKQWDLWHFVFARRLLLDFTFRGDVMVVGLDSPDALRMSELMQTYASLPMDLPDASLVVVAERFNLRRVFSFDSDFRVYRPRHIRSFEVIP